MRRIVLLLPVLVAAGILFACEDSGSSPATIDTPETGSFEAGPTPDAAPPPDGASIDAAEAAAAPLSVVVHVTRSGAPEANVSVVFHDAAGSVLETKTTGADGRATSTPGVTPSQATALLGGPGVRRLLTWTAVELGDELFAADVGTPSSAGTYDVALQGNFSDGGAVRATATVGSCTAAADTAAATVTLPLAPDCARPAASILATAFDQFDAPAAYAFVKAQPEPSGGGTANASVGPWMKPATATIGATNPPANANLSGSLIEVSGALGFTNVSGSGFANGAEAFVVAPGFADAYQAEVRIAPNLISGATLLVAKRAAPATMSTIDLSTALAALDSASIDATDARRPVIAWTTAGGASLATTDGGSIAIHWSDSRSDDLGWSFVVAPGTTSVKAPVLPASADAWAPRGALDGGVASSFDQPEVTFVETDLLAGYKDLRRDIGRIVPLVPTSNRDSRAVLPAAGTLRATSFFAVPQ